MGAHRKAPRLRRARSILTVAIATAGALVWAAQSSSAVHNTGQFELDGNVVRNAPAPPPYDWTDLFNANGSQKITPDPINGPILASVFVDDTDAIDNTYFAGGTKIDDRVHNMSCGGPAANDKTSMDYAYAAMVQIPVGAPDNAGDQVLYLGLEKQAAGNGGDNAFGFWLFKDKSVGCSGGGAFTGAHTDGDLFIDGLFTNGGGASDVKVFEWSGNDTTGSLNPVAIATGDVCGVVTNDQQCAIANSGVIDSGPWRSSATMAANTFVEAGIDLTAILGSAGGCFSTFMADSQASQDTNSQPKDFVGGQLSTCVAPPISTTATPGGAAVPLGATNQHDVATITSVANHGTASGTITFFLCDPSEVTAGGCESGGTQVGTAVDIANGSATSADADGSLISTTGKYCWRAEYAPDVAASAFYSAGSHTDATDECFTVVQNPTLIATAATSETIGAAINDTATLSGGVNPTGTITFDLYGPSPTPVCTGDPVYSNTVNVNGNGDYGSGDFIPDTAGNYYWIASYSGDDNNLPSHGTCGDEGETSTINQMPTAIGTAATSDTIGATVNDVATLSGATDDATGTITFNLFGPSDTPDCTGVPVFTDTVDVAGPGDYQSADFAPTTAGSYYWIASYSGDVNNLPSIGTCGDDGETSGLAQRATDITTEASSSPFGGKLTDTATLTGATDDATGTITFNVYGPSATPDCSGDPTFTDTVQVSGPGDYTTDGFRPTHFGRYYWTASYSGDANNLASEEPCGSPHERSILEAEGGSSEPPPPPHGTSGTGAPVKGELELVLILLGAGLALLVIGRRRRGAHR